MPRGPRLDAEGVLHHVMGRGIERRDIFRSDDDRRDFLARIAAVGPDTATAIYAWSLLPNHFHLLLRSGARGISTFMRRLQTGYAVAFNRRHRRVGHLFQNRFKSVLVEEEPYFLELVRYLHLNPLRAGVVETMRGLDHYPWSGHAVILGNREAPWQDVGEVLRRFGSAPGRARAAYRRFISEGVRQGRRPELSGGGLVRSIGGREKIEEFRRGRERWVSDERVLGSGEFAERVLGEAGRRLERLPRVQRQGELLTELLEVVARRRGVEVREMRGSGRRPAVAGARGLFCLLAVHRLGVAQATVARFLGLTPPAVTRALSRKATLAEDLEIELERLAAKYI